MTIENMWGELHEIDSVRSSFTILKEQGALVSEMTGGDIRGEVSRMESRPPNIRIDLDLLVPKMNNYSIEILRISYQVHKFYPVYVSTEFSNHEECDTEEEFMGALRTIPGSDPVMKILTALRAQVRDE